MKKGGGKGEEPRESTERYFQQQRKSRRGRKRLRNQQLTLVASGEDVAQQEIAVGQGDLWTGWPILLRDGVFSFRTGSSFDRCPKAEFCFCVLEMLLTCHGSSSKDLTSDRHRMWASRPSICIDVLFMHANEIK